MTPWLTPRKNLHCRDKVFYNTILQALIKEEFSSDILYADTTAKLIYGDYPQEKGLNITFGYNKEHRRDLKHFKIGLLTNAQGYPLASDIFDDIIWNKMLLNTLSKQFKAEKLKSLTYVADSAFVTETNLALAEIKELKFISLLPATYELAEEQKLKAL